MGVVLDSSRNSNLELYRIICMLMIIAHHFVVNSGLELTADLFLKNQFLLFFGMWGKTGINCFLMVTGFYMCTKSISARKYVKLLLQVYFYKIIIYFIFLAYGYETICLSRLVEVLMPVWGFNSNFVSCFLAFYLLIPFLAKLVRNLTQRQHIWLIALLLLFYTLLGSLPRFEVSINYINWFSIIFIIASYIRMHPIPLFDQTKIWGWMTVLGGVFALLSVFMMHYLGKISYFFVFETNKVFPVWVAITSFLWFKNLKIRKSTIINLLGGSTFGVLLIHANSNAMRKWLWQDTFDVIAHYSLPSGQLILYSISTVIIVFTICSSLDIIRMVLIEKPFLKWYDKCHFDDKIEKLLGIVNPS